MAAKTEYRTLLAPRSDADPGESPAQGKCTRVANGRNVAVPFCRIWSRWLGSATVCACIICVTVGTLRRPPQLHFFSVEDKVLLSVSHRIQPLVAQIEQTFKPIATSARGSFDAECHMNREETCKLNDMARGNLTAVFPGQGTRCIFSSSPAYLFQVIRGDGDKLLIHFDMGGACWDEVTANSGICLSGVAEVGREGIFSRSNKDNPFGMYTVITIGYCSGDAHVGAVKRDWLVPEAGNISQQGYHNARIAIDWVKANVGVNKLKTLVLTGSSAGSLGVQVWSGKLLSEFAYDSAAVIADSFAGIFPAAVQGSQQRDVNLCETELLPESMLARCRDGTLEVEDIYEQTMRDFPDVAFASIDSKVDIVQITFYEIIHATLLKSTDYTMMPAMFYSRLAAVYRRYDAQPNWISYMVNSKEHMFLPKDLLYHTRPGSTLVKTSGLLGAGLRFAGVSLKGADTPLVDWLRDLPVRPGNSARSVCRGLANKIDAPAPSSTPTAIGTAFRTFKTMISSSTAPLVEESADVTGLGHCNIRQADKVFTRPT